MSQSLAIQLCRIVAPEKLPDRFLSSGILQQKDNFSISEQVILLYVFEVTKPWFPSSTVIPSLTSCLTEQHSKLVADDTLGDQFELLLRTVNEQLNALSEQGETDWIGNFNGMIMILGGDQLHFSQTGSSPAYLLQNNRIRQITDEGTGDREPHPLKTFSNLASGSLQAGDQLLISNHELYREISLDALRRIISKNTPYQSLLTITKELKREKNYSVSPIIVTIIPSEATLPQSEPASIILEDEMQSPARKLQKRLLPILKVIGRVSKQAGNSGLTMAKQGGAVLKDTVAPKAAEMLQKGTEGAKNITTQVSNKIASRTAEKSASSEVVPEEVPLALPAEEPATEAVIQIVLPKSEREKEHHAEIAKVAEQKAEEAYTKTTPDSVIPQDELSLESTSPIGLMSTEPTKAELPTSTSSPLKNLLSNTRNRKIAILAAAILLLALGIISAIIKRKPVAVTSAQNQTNVSIQQVTDLEKKIDTAIKLNQEIEASREIVGSQKTLTEIKDPTDAQNKQISTLWDALTLQSDTLTKTVRLSTASTTYSFTGSSSGLIVTPPYAYGFSPSEAGVLRTGQGDPSSTQKVLPLTDTADSVISLTKSQEADTTAYALTTHNHVYRIVQSETSTLLRPVSLASPTDNFAKGDSIATYIGNIYILDGVTGLLWKYPNTGTTYGPGISVIDKNKFDIKNSVSITIDGSIYILKKDGSLMRFTSGQQDTSFALKDQPELSKKLIQPLQVITDDSQQSVFILDAGLSSSDRSTAKVLEFSKSGSFIRQFGLPKEYTNVHGFDINTKDKKLWILNGNTISEFPI
jgi:hypothetical protein